MVCTDLWYNVRRQAALRRDLALGGCPGNKRTTNKKERKMKKLMMVAALAAVSASMVGCKSTNVDEWRSDLKTQLCPAKFKPVYTVMKDKGIVTGEASES